MPPPFLQPSCVLRSRFEAVLSNNLVAYPTVNHVANQISRVKFVWESKVDAAGFIQRYGWACHIEHFGFLRTGSTKHLCLFAGIAVQKKIRNSAPATAGSE